jgi:hypothetical protein
VCYVIAIRQNRPEPRAHSQDMQQMEMQVSRHVYVPCSTSIRNAALRSMRGTKASSPRSSRMRPRYSPKPSVQKLDPSSQGVCYRHCSKIQLARTSISDLIASVINARRGKERESERVHVSPSRPREHVISPWPPPPLYIPKKPIAMEHHTYSQDTVDLIALRCDAMRWDNMTHVDYNSSVKPPSTNRMWYPH